jgi:hypothetical protein
MIPTRIAFAFATVCSIAAHDVRAQDVSPAIPQTSGAAAETANRSIDKKGLGLSSAQEQMIVASTMSEKVQSATSAPAIGEPVPDAMMLVEFPVEVKDQIGLLRDFKFARLQNDTVLLVDPTSRVVVDVIQN